MKTAVVACKTLRDELGAACAETGCEYPVMWIEPGLHNVPARLRETLQPALDACEGYERVLLAFGFCGNSMAGLRTRGFELILPRADDCISLLLGSHTRRAGVPRTYFLTRGWLMGERTIWDEYRYTVNTYGEETGKELFAAMLEGYRYLGVIDTGCYPLGDILGQTQRIAETLGLEQKILAGSSKYLAALLTGPWDATRFLRFPPETEIAAGDLTLA